MLISCFSTRWFEGQSKLGIKLVDTSQRDAVAAATPQRASHHYHRGDYKVLQGRQTRPARQLQAAKEQHGQLSSSAPSKEAVFFMSYFFVVVLSSTSPCTLDPPCVLSWRPESSQSQQKLSLDLRARSYCAHSLIQTGRRSLKQSSSLFSFSLKVEIQATSVG